jgi:hypothetical protein
MSTSFPVFAQIYCKSQILPAGFLSRPVVHPLKMHVTTLSAVHNVVVIVDVSYLKKVWLLV